MKTSGEIKQFHGKRLSEVDEIKIEQTAKPDLTIKISGLYFGIICMFIGAIGGYFLTALIVARHWGDLP